MTIGELTKSSIVAGQGGISRKITTIEVMEVPEVVSWVTPGILVMTTFYSIQNDEQKQIEIVQTLMDVKAAGIVIKLGRFVDHIPQEMLQIANENDFPIIIIPKSVSYINVLTPLYERLYVEKQQAESVNNPFAAFESKSFSSLATALEEISVIMNSPVYIEDMDGALLYVSNTFLANGWRKSSGLFSKPVHSSYEEKLQEWKKQFVKKEYDLLKIEGFRDCLVMPLVSNKQVFATLHIPYIEKLESVQLVTGPLKKVMSTIIELFMNEQLFLQKKRMKDLEHLESFVMEEEGESAEKDYFVVRFQAAWMEKLFASSPYLLDPSCLVHKALHGYLDGLPSATPLVFEKYYHFYALLTCRPDGYAGALQQLEERLKERGMSIFVAAGPPMKDRSMLDESIRLVDKMMDIGRMLRSEETFYTYDKLGIYEILIKLTSDDLVQNYAGTILSPLLETPTHELLETLQMYLNENGNVTKTSEKLFIHRRTLTYRIQKIQELLNINVDDADSRFILNFCLKIKQLAK
nr:PucR family transcriptional regulator [Sporosarcina cyprini]